jgi:hypothetical protein
MVRWWWWWWWNGGSNGVMVVMLQNHIVDGGGGGDGGMLAALAWWRGNGGNTKYTFIGRVSHRLPNVIEEEEFLVTTCGGGTSLKNRVVSHSCSCAVRMAGLEQLGQMQRRARQLQFELLHTGGA